VEILRQQRAVGQRVARVGIEPGGHGDEVGPEIFQVAERAGERGAPDFARCARRDGIIETVRPNIRRARAGKAGKLVNGKNAQPGRSSKMASVPLP